jgi:hypothetical protein
MNSSATSSTTASDLQILQVERLAATERGNVGFIPIQSYREALTRNRLFTLQENGDLLAFVLVGERRGLIRIHQIVTRHDARRMMYAAGVLIKACQQLADKQPTMLVCRVREDIDAHMFWMALGFDPIGLTQHSPHSNRKLIIYGRGVPWTPSQTPTSLTFSDGLACRFQGTLDHGLVTPRSALSACGILDRRQLSRPVSRSVAAAIDLALLSTASRPSPLTPKRPGKPCPNNYTSVSPESTFGFT